MSDAGKNRQRSTPKRIVIFYTVFLAISLLFVFSGIIRLFTEYTLGVGWIDSILSSWPAALFVTLGGIGLCSMAIMGWRADNQDIKLRRRRA